MSLKITGKLPAGKLLDRIKLSPNYKKQSFQNSSPTAMMAEDASYWKMSKDFFKPNKLSKPSAPIPTIQTNLHRLPDTQPSIVWFGHSSYLIRIDHKTILVDPVLSGNAAPVSFMVKAFPGSDIYKPADMPEIDYLIITHDHYDHLDFKTIVQLGKKIKQVYCSLGVGSHLTYWGLDPAIIHDLDWWDTAQLTATMTLTAAPARHFSGRGLKRGQTLWSSFVLITPEHRIYIGGDSGYDDHFKQIGEKYGPFDVAILESGQYNTMWPLIHMMPEQTVQAAIDLKAALLLPVHWGKFALAMHAWNEPIQRIVWKAAELNQPVITPRIGEVVMVGNAVRPVEKWWAF